MSRDQRKCSSGSGGVSGSRCFLRENRVLTSVVMSSLCISHNLHELRPQHPGDTHESGFIKAVTPKRLTKCLCIHYLCLRSISPPPSGCNVSGVMIYEMMYNKQKFLLDGQLYFLIAEIAKTLIANTFSVTLDAS